MLTRTSAVLAATLIAMVAGCSPVPAPVMPVIGGREVSSRTGGGAPAVIETRRGLASYYGAGLHGGRTASGVPFDMHAMVAAHPTYPFGTRVRVTRVGTAQAVEVEIVDRGPARAARAAGVIIDLSRGAAAKLAFLDAGRTAVRVDVLQWGNRDRAAVDR